MFAGQADLIFMKEITGKQKAKSNVLHREIKVDKTISKNLKDVSQELNKYFTSVGKIFGRKNPQY